ncbi:DUF4432 domain-containing protein [Paenibacillus baekrokdamisoli]|uniref:DUF4432 domain-containing protein n=1 Tax=Paenibacillus baekrokdamisoli TaxID=1712516 RepID=A0A3G9J8L1_9BACL|nr:aldose 1-epimerase family protein [Paenibacillus baekrokdamisoli]MBB3070910.1 hypothetical protein [Paenibacillus baekrokdamisoli]BBH22151.1 DUF4432 domain-containing protein [Paenibacillus baekrokdamisoli]
MQLFDRFWTRRQLEARIGRTDAIFGLRRYKGTEGFETEVEWIRMQSGAGLNVEICPSKALDLTGATFHGVPISWSCVNGDVHPAYYVPNGAEWLRTASGGLLMTCGLAHVGEPAVEQGEVHGLHGRIHHIPAKQVVAEGNWEQDDYTMRVAGVMEESSIFGRHLRLTREIRMNAGENRIVLTDTVTNFGFQTAEHMMLYHFNFGFPLLDEQTSLLFPHTAELSKIGGGEATGYKRWPLPDSGDDGAVYEHQLNRQAIGEDGMAEAIILNPSFPLPGPSGRHLPVEMHLRWSADTLPCLTQWVAPMAGEHVLSIEPGNCGVMGRSVAREKGTLCHLAPGESVQYRVELEVMLS